MNLGLMIYLISIVDGIWGVFLAGTIILGLYLFVSGIVVLIDDIDSIDFIKRFYKVKRKITTIFTILLCLSIFAPSSKVVATMYLLPKIAENKDVQEIPAKVSKVLNSKLDEWIDGYTKTKSK